MKFNSNFIPATRLYLVSLPILFLIFSPIYLQSQNCKECACFIEKAKYYCWEQPNLDTLIYLRTHVVESKCSENEFDMYKAYLMAGVKECLDIDPRKKVKYKKLLSDIFWTVNDSLTLIVNRQGKFGFVDKNLQIKIPCQYDEASELYWGLGGYSKVKRNNKYYYLSANQNEYPFSRSLNNLTKDVGVLDLSNQKITHLPDSICQYTNLRVLILHDNMIETLPKDITQLQNLEEFGMESNPLKSLPENFGNLKKLKYFDIASCKVEELPNSFCDLAALKSCHINRNRITSLPSNFGNLRNLEEFNLWGCSITELPNSFSSLINLKNLTLTATKIATLPTDFYKLKKLTVLGLSNINSALPPRFDELQALNFLFLSNSEIEKFPLEITRLRNLEYLSFSDSKLSELPKEIKRLKKLTTLDVSRTKIKNLPSSIGQLKNLNRLYIGNNLTELPKEIGKLQNLVLLNIRDNKISKLPNEIINLKNLKDLYIYGNPMSKAEIEKLKANMPNCKIGF